MEHGHHVLRACAKSAVLRMYEKFTTFLRLEVLSNNLKDFGPKKSLDHLEALRLTLATVTKPCSPLSSSQPKHYTLTQLRYDLRKLKAHALLERDGHHYAYRLTDKGIRSPSCSPSFTSASAAHWPTVSSTANPPKSTHPPANFMPLIRKQTLPSRK
jgi:hypothetical protein